jgi:hypothetical protein
MGSLGFGFGFFGDPIIRRGLAILNQDFPHWQKIFELQKQVSPDACKSDRSITDSWTVRF